MNHINSKLKSRTRMLGMEPLEGRLTMAADGLSFESIQLLPTFESYQITEYWGAETAYPVMEAANSWDGRNAQWNSGDDEWNSGNAEPQSIDSQLSESDWSSGVALGLAELGFAHLRSSVTSGHYLFEVPSAMEGLLFETWPGDGLPSDVTPAALSVSLEGRAATFVLEPYYDRFIESRLAPDLDWVVIQSGAEVWGMSIIVSPSPEVKDEPGTHVPTWATMANETFALFGQPGLELHQSENNPRSLSSRSEPFLVGQSGWKEVTLKSTPEGAEADSSYASLPELLSRPSGEVELGAQLPLDIKPLNRPRWSERVSTELSDDVSLLVIDSLTQNSIPAGMLSIGGEEVILRSRSTIPALADGFIVQTALLCSPPENIAAALSSTNVTPSPVPSEIGDVQNVQPTAAQVFHWAVLGGAVMLLRTGVWPGRAHVHELVLRYWRQLVYAAKQILHKYRW